MRFDILKSSTSAGEKSALHPVFVPVRLLGGGCVDRLDQLGPCLTWEGKP